VASHRQGAVVEQRSQQRPDLRRQRIAVVVDLDPARRELDRELGRARRESAPHQLGGELPGAVELARPELA
jgi:hypothetical protein